MPPVYSFDWEVLDSYSKNDYGHQETRNDKTTTGSYHVALPDGRVQRVTYSVDGYGGYTAEVTYEGDASYPEATPYQPRSYPVVQPYSAASQAAPVRAAAPVAPAAPVVPVLPVTAAPVAAAPVTAAPVVKEAPAPAPVQIAEPVDIRIAEPITAAPTTIRRYV